MWCLLVLSRPQGLTLNMKEVVSPVCAAAVWWEKCLQHVLLGSCFCDKFLENILTKSNDWMFTCEQKSDWNTPVTAHLWCLHSQDSRCCSPAVNCTWSSPLPRHTYHASAPLALVLNQPAHHQWLFTWSTFVVVVSLPTCFWPALSFWLCSSDWITGVQTSLPRHLPPVALFFCLWDISNNLFTASALLRVTCWDIISWDSVCCQNYSPAVL